MAMKKQIVDAETGEVTEVEMTPEEEAALRATWGEAPQENP